MQMQESGYTLDCVAHACKLAQLLRDAGQAPWIGRVRETRVTERGTFHAPLTPLKLWRSTWTTHYVCCADGHVYDPIESEPVPIDRYVEVVFGRTLSVEEFLSADRTAELLQRGELRRAFRVYH